MQTEFILNGYQVIRIQRQNKPDEVLVCAPYGVDQRFAMIDLNRWIGQLERELEVMRLAKAMLEPVEGHG